MTVLVDYLFFQRAPVRVSVNVSLYRIMREKTEKEMRFVYERNNFSGYQIRTTRKNFKVLAEFKSGMIAVLPYNRLGTMN